MKKLLKVSTLLALGAGAVCVCYKLLKKDKVVEIRNDKDQIIVLNENLEDNSNANKK